MKKAALCTLLSSAPGRTQRPASYDPPRNPEGVEGPRVRVDAGATAEADQHTRAASVWWQATARLLPIFLPTSSPPPSRCSQTSPTSAGLTVFARFQDHVY